MGSVFSLVKLALHHQNEGQIIERKAGLEAVAFLHVPIDRERFFQRPPRSAQVILHNLQRADAGEHGRHLRMIIAESLSRHAERP